MKNTQTTEKATFGAGCFWGVEVAFRKAPGVMNAAVGYMGGSTKNPSYEDVCSGQTGHAEVVQIDYDPARITYDDLLKIFWENHNPTTRNAQGPDIGYQYRSVIFFHTKEQQAAAHASKASVQASEKYKNKEIVTEISPAQEFYRAEEYHQQYLVKHGGVSCHI